MDRFFYSKFSPNRNEPFVGLTNDGDILRYTPKWTAVWITNPPNPGEIDPVVLLFDLETLRVAERILAFVLLLFGRAAGPARVEVLNATSRSTIVTLTNASLPLAGETPFLA